MKTSKQKAVRTSDLASLSRRKPISIAPANDRAAKRDAPVPDIKVTEELNLHRFPQHPRQSPDEFSAGQLTQKMDFVNDENNELQIIQPNPATWQNTDLPEKLIKILKKFWDDRTNLWQALAKIGVIQADQYDRRDLVNAWGWERSRIQRAFERKINKIIQRKNTPQNKRDDAQEAWRLLEEVKGFEIGGTDPDRDLPPNEYSPAAAWDSLSSFIRKHPETVLEPDNEINLRFQVFEVPPSSYSPKTSLEMTHFINPAIGLMSALHQANIQEFKFPRHVVSVGAFFRVK